MSTVRELLDALHAGTKDLDEVAADFRIRQWPAPPQASEAEVWGVADADVPDPDGFGMVDADSLLTPQQYLVLVNAYRDNPQHTAAAA